MRQLIAVVGGGIFGTTIARKAAQAGFAVHLFERNEDLMLGATAASQARLHSGYHYPRCPSLGLRPHAEAFTAEYHDHVVRAAEHYYCIASEGSYLSGEQYLSFCEATNLPYTVSRPAAIRAEAVDVAVRVPEALIDVARLRAYLHGELARLGVQVFLRHETDSRALAGYDWVVNATYGRGIARPLRWEICETAVLDLGPDFRRTSMVVMDGPFFSLDPVPGQPSHVLYDVVNSVHAFNIGHEAAVPDHLAPLIDRGLVMTPHTSVNEMLATARRFLHGLTDPAYRGSRFSLRAVLPDVDATDERPTLVEQDGNHLAVLSGKIDMSVWAARRVLEIIKQVPDGLDQAADPPLNQVVGSLRSSGEFSLPRELETPPR